MKWEYAKVLKIIQQSVQKKLEIKVLDKRKKKWNRGWLLGIDVFSGLVRDRTTLVCWDSRWLPCTKYQLQRQPWRTISEYPFFDLRLRQDDLTEYLLKSNYCIWSRCGEQALACRACRWSYCCIEWNETFCIVVGMGEEKRKIAICNFQGFPYIYKLLSKQYNGHSRFTCSWIPWPIIWNLPYNVFRVDK